MYHLRGKLNMKPLSKLNYNRLQESLHKCPACGSQMILVSSTKYISPVKPNYSPADSIFRRLRYNRKKCDYNGVDHTMCGQTPTREHHSRTRTLRGFTAHLDKFNNLKALLLSLVLTPSLVILASIIL